MSNALRIELYKNCYTELAIIHIANTVADYVTSNGCKCTVKAIHPGTMQFELNLHTDSPSSIDFSTPIDESITRLIGAVWESLSPNAKAEYEKMVNAKRLLNMYNIVITHVESGKNSLVAVML